MTLTETATFIGAVVILAAVVGIACLVFYGVFIHPYLKDEHSGDNHQDLSGRLTRIEADIRDLESRRSSVPTIGYGYNYWPSAPNPNEAFGGSPSYAVPLAVVKRIGKTKSK